MNVVMLPAAAKDQTKAAPDPSFASLQPYRNDIDAFLLATYGYSNLIVSWHLDSAVKQDRPKLPKLPLAGKQLSAFERVPRELFDAIVMRCGPLDLLALSRTSNMYIPASDSHVQADYDYSFRQYLTSKSAQNLWMASISRAYGLYPGCSKATSQMIALGMTPIHFLQAIRLRQCLICGDLSAPTVVMPISVRLCTVCKGSQPDPSARKILFPDKTPDALSKHEKMVLNGLSWDYDKRPQILPGYGSSSFEGVHAPAYTAYLNRCKAVLEHFGLTKRQLLVALKKKAQAEIVLHKELYESIYKLTSMRRQPYFRYGTGM